MKHCVRCDRDLPLDCYGSHKGTRDGLQRLCRDCTNAVLRERRQVRRERYDPANSHTSKRCWRCQETKPADAFNIDRGGVGGLASTCKLCRADLEMQKRYGISVQHFDDMLMRQGGACAVCKIEGRELVVDHDHASGAVRGLLCNPCNLALGHLQDDPVRIGAMLTYLDR